MSLTLIYNAMHYSGKCVCLKVFFRILINPFNFKKSLDKSGKLIWHIRKTFITLPDIKAGSMKRAQLFKILNLVGPWYIGLNQF